MVVLDPDHPPKEGYGELLVDRIRIDEARCIQCGDCSRACLEENDEKQALTNIVKERFLSVRNATEPDQPILLQKILRMSEDAREEFWHNEFKRCIKCYGCLDVCPVYLNESDELDLMKWRTAGQVPPVYPLFHLVRAYKIWDSCTGCGECEKTCPANIPLKTIQDMVKNIPAETIFGLIPGLDDEAKKEIMAFVAKRNASSKGAYYAI